MKKGLAQRAVLLALVMIACASVLVSAAPARTTLVAGATSTRHHGRTTNPTGIRVKHFKLPGLYGAMPFDTNTVAVDAGDTWFLYGYYSQGKITTGIGRVTPAGQVTSFPLPWAGWTPEALTAGPDGALWFTMNGLEESAVGRLTTSGELSYYPLPGPTDLSAPCNLSTFGRCSTGFYYEARGIASADGDLWVAGGLNTVWRITPTDDVTTFHAPASAGLPASVAAGSNGSVLVVSTSTNSFLLPSETLANVTPVGVISESPPLASQNADKRLSAGIVPDPSGDVWLGGDGFLERVTAAGQVTKYPIDATASNGALGSEGEPWFATTKGLVTITKAGRPKEYRFPGRRYNRLSGIAAGSGRTLWLLEYGSESIVRITIN